MSGSTARGRFLAITLGIIAGGFASMYVLRDFELVKRLDDPLNNENRPFRVRFERSKEIKLKPEAKERINNEIRQISEPKNV